MLCGVASCSTKVSEASTLSSLHDTWSDTDFIFNVCLWKPRALHSSSLVMRFVYHQPWNNHARFIFPELHSFKRLTAVSFDQLQSGISVTQHIASNCTCQREWLDEDNKSGTVNNKDCTCVALGRWCCCFSGRKTKSLADNTAVQGGKPSSSLTTNHHIKCNRSRYASPSEDWRKKSEVFDVKMPTGDIFFLIKES